MRKPESRFWDQVRPLLAGLDPVRIENTCEQGTPDVNYIHGWIELKVVKKWPKREMTALQIPHYTEHQKAWARRRHEAGGQVWFLLKIEEEWLLIYGVSAAHAIGELPRNALYRICTARWSSPPSKEAFQRVILA
jgi:hypothetical protein